MVDAQNNIFNFFLRLPPAFVTFSCSAPELPSASANSESFAIFSVPTNNCLFPFLFVRAKNFSDHSSQSVAFPKKLNHSDAFQVTHFKNYLLTTLRLLVFSKYNLLTSLRLCVAHTTSETSSALPSETSHLLACVQDFFQLKTFNPNSAESASSTTITASALQSPNTLSPHGQFPIPQFSTLFTTDCSLGQNHLLAPTHFSTCPGNDSINWLAVSRL